VRLHHPARPVATDEHRRDGCALAPRAEITPAERQDVSEGRRHVGLGEADRQPGLANARLVSNRQHHPASSGSRASRADRIGTFANMIGTVRVNCLYVPTTYKISVSARSEKCRLAASYHRFCPSPRSDPSPHR
jgi:hypothetical protein